MCLFVGRYYSLIRFSYELKVKIAAAVFSTWRQLQLFLPVLSGKCFNTKIIRVVCVCLYVCRHHTAWLNIDRSLSHPEAVEILTAANGPDSSGLTNTPKKKDFSLFTKDSANKVCSSQRLLHHQNAFHCLILVYDRFRHRP